MDCASIAGAVTHVEQTRLPARRRVAVRGRANVAGDAGGGRVREVANALLRSLDEDDVHVWIFDDAPRPHSKGQAVRRREAVRADRATYRLGVWRSGASSLVGVSNTNRVGDATMQLVRGR